MVSSYGTEQRTDRDKFNSVYSVAGLNSDIPMTSRSDPWDARASTDTLPAPGQFGHGRNESTSSDVAMLSEQHPQFRDSPSYPAGAYTQAPEPTPHQPQYRQYSDPYYNGGASLDPPQQFQAHPGECGFRAFVHGG